MKSIIQTTLLFLAVLCSQMLHSQNTISYGYDLAGNRISRTIKMPGLKSAPAPQPQAVVEDEEAEEEQPPVVYSEMLSDIEIKIYPNPTDGFLKVEIRNLPEGQTADIRLFDMSGRSISAYREIRDFVEVDISGQPTGTYLMRIVAGEYRTEWKIIKK